MILPNSEQMRRIDQCAIDQFKIPGIVLMENAGLGTVMLMERLLGNLSDCFIPIFIGPGNNGGDGLVMARHLYQRKAFPLLVFLIEPALLRGDSARNYAMVKELNLDSEVLSDSDRNQRLTEILQQRQQALGPPAVIVDAIFGTGLDRNLSGHFLEVVGQINALSKTHQIPVIAVDTPSGLNSNNGEVLGDCIRATATATYGFAKVGQVLPGSGQFTGELQVIDIGIPDRVLQQVEVTVAAIDANNIEVYKDSLQRQLECHKGSNGHLLIVGGSTGKTGAALLAARGAIRCGCGLVSLCTPANLNVIYQSSIAEAMTVVVQTEDLLSSADLDIIKSNLNGKTCVVVGPGIGQDPGTVELVLELYHSSPLPMVIDADGLNSLALKRDDLKVPAGPRILTPHPGEMARLIGMSASEVQADRFAALQRCFNQFKAADSELIIVLKGSGTLTSDGSSVWVNRSGNPSMATGGIGDVLSGVIGSLVCQGLDCYKAARFGAFLHGCSGDRLQERTGVGFSASELADELSPTLTRIIGEQR